MDYQQYLDANQVRFVEEYLEFLRFQSISALPTHAPDVQCAAEWVAGRVMQAGLENVQVMQTGGGGHPVVYGDWLHAPGQPTVLIYGHYDVQPAGLDQFKPCMKTVDDEERVYARGATDSKGNMFPTIVALEGLLQSECRLPVNVKLCYEGEEEIGSPHLSNFLACHKNKFACDVAVSSDAYQFSQDRPSLTLAQRGACMMQVKVSSDPPSGSAVCNPLVTMLAKLHKKNGAVAVPRFYDEVCDATKEEREHTEAVPEKEFLDEINAHDASVLGESGFTTHERIGLRPTLEIMALWSGDDDQNPEKKMIVPQCAGATISCRLVANQEPAKIKQLLQTHLSNAAPKKVKVEVTDLKVDSKVSKISTSNCYIKAAVEVLKNEYCCEPLYLYSGGSSPFIGCAMEHLKVKTINFGFELNDEGAHSSAEFFRLFSFQRSQRLYAELLRRLKR